MGYYEGIKPSISTGCFNHTNPLSKLELRFPGEGEPQGVYKLVLVRKNLWTWVGIEPTTLTT